MNKTAEHIDWNEEQEWLNRFCVHGVAPDVHCCNCHSGFLFGQESCVCGFEKEKENGRN